MAIRLLEFTPLEFETEKIGDHANLWLILEFTPLEFETAFCIEFEGWSKVLEFTPLEFETLARSRVRASSGIRIYSVGV